MMCGNDPNAKLTPEDQVWMDWFERWLRWAKTQEGEEPADPNGKFPSKDGNRPKRFQS